MAHSLGNVIADSLDQGLLYADRMLAGVTVDKFARLAAPGGAVVQSNHPAFVYGHLSLYSPRIVSQLGADATHITPPEDFASVFSRDATCRDDARGDIYPSMEEVTGMFSNGYRAAADALRRATDEALAQANPLGGRMTELFPTLGSMFAFYAGGHLMFHLGQVSAWRRMMGLGSA
jgi:hypothetical protein